jgi:hypothetical protein
MDWTYIGSRFTKDRMHYAGTLYRGWELVRLDYALEDNAIVMRRKRTWKGLQEQRVELASLSGAVRRVRARQPAFVISTAVLVVALFVLGIDAMVHGVGANGPGVSWTLWGPLLAVSGFMWVVRFKTRRGAEWTYFMGTNKGGGLFVLRDPKNAVAHEKFVAAVRQRLPETP